MASRCILLLLYFFTTFVISPVRSTNLGIPGTTQTENGYDTELGTDAICWRSNADESDGAGSNGVTFPNELIKDFKLNGSVTLLTACPANNTLQATAPPEYERGERLRVKTWYNFTVHVTLNLTSLGGSAFVSDNETHKIAGQVIVCKQGVAGFCSPFIHEESNQRLAEQGITKSPPRGDLHGDTHVHSPYIPQEVEPQDGPFYNFTMTIPLIVNEPGDFFAIATVQMFIASNNNNSSTTSAAVATMRYDMANALVGQQRLITIQTQADILEVPDAVLIISYVGIGIVATVIIYLLYQTIQNRNHQVLRLTQGYFLILFLVAALTATVSSFLLQPKNDIYCQVSKPLILISLQLLYSITIGRLWRINAVISPLLMQTLRQRQSVTSRSMQHLTTRLSNCCELWRRPRCCCCLKKDDYSERPKTLRKQISPWQLGIVVMLFTLPQIVLQVLSVTLQPQERVVYFNPDESIGRATCSSGVRVAASLLYYGFYAFLLLIVILLIMAHATRGLPSLFNETQVIFESTLTSLILLVLGLGVLAVTYGPTISPGVDYLIWVVLVLSITLNSSVRIMLPKLRMVWRNETVLVSKLVTDHRESVRRKDARYSMSTHFTSNNNGSATGGVCISGLHDTNSTGFYNTSPGNNNYITTYSGYSAGTTHSNSQEVKQELEEFENEPGVYRESSNVVDTPIVEEEEEGEDDDEGNEQEGEREAADDLEECPEPTSLVRAMTPGTMLVRASELPSRNGRMLKNRIVVTKDETPARRLVLKMVDLQGHLARVNQRIMSGMAVAEDEWDTLRRLSAKMGETFQDEVIFEWEADKLLDSSGELSREMSEKEDSAENAGKETEASNIGLLHGLADNVRERLHI